MTELRLCVAAGLDLNGVGENPLHLVLQYTVGFPAAMYLIGEVLPDEFRVDGPKDAGAIRSGNGDAAMFLLLRAFLDGTAAPRRARTLANPSGSRGILALATSGRTTRLHPVGYGLAIVVLHLSRCPLSYARILFTAPLPVPLRVVGPDDAIERFQADHEEHHLYIYTHRKRHAPPALWIDADGAVVVTIPRADSFPSPVMQLLPATGVPVRGLGPIGFQYAFDTQGRTSMWSQPLDADLRVSDIFHAFANGFAYSMLDWKGQILVPRFEHTDFLAVTMNTCSCTSIGGVVAGARFVVHCDQPVYILPVLGGWRH